MSDARNPLEARRRRAIWRAGHRGMKELDLTLGAFASREVPLMTEQQLAAFEDLIDVNEDNDLYQWLIGTAPVPAAVETDMLRRWLKAARTRRLSPKTDEA